MKLEKLSWVDALKGIAICGIVMIHSGGAKLPSYLGSIGAAGKNGVQLFFLISSFLTFTSYKNGEQKFKKWFFHRIVKLIPLYYISIVVAVLFGGAGEYWLVGDRITIKNVVVHLLFLHGFFPGYVDSIIGVEWYLGALVIFYMLIPILCKKICTLEKSIVYFIWCSIVCQLIIQICTRVTQDLSYEYIYDAYFNTFWFIAQFPVMLLGIVFYYIRDLGKKVNNKRIFANTLFFCFLVMIGGMIVRENKLLGLSECTLFGICFLVLAFSQSVRSTFVIDNKLFRLLGKNSYPIYLFHYFIIKLYERYVPEPFENLVVSWSVKYIVVLAISLFIAIIVSKYIEKPLVTKTNNLFDFVMHCS